MKQPLPEFNLFTSVVVIGILLAMFYGFMYFPVICRVFARKRKVKHPSATVRSLDEFENKISE